MKKYQSPKMLFFNCCNEDIMTTSYGDKFGVILDWESDGGNGEA